MNGPALELLASLPVGDGDRWGDGSAPFQRGDAEAVFAASGPRFHFLTRPPVAAKAPMQPGSLWPSTSPRRRSARHPSSWPPTPRRPASSWTLSAASCSANRSSARQFVSRARRVVFLRGKEMVSTVEVLPADEASAFGLRPWLAIADELAVWPSSRNAKGVWAAVLSAMPKVPHARLVVLTSAGAPDHWSHAVLEHARTSPQWRVSETPGPLPWIPAEVLDEQRRLLTPSLFARLHLNAWTAGEDRLTTPAQVRACVGHSAVLPPETRHRYVAALDVGLVNDRTVLTVAHLERRADPVVVVDRVEVWQGTKANPVQLSDVEAVIAEAVRDYRGARLVVDPWQAAHLCQRLRTRGVRVEEFSFSSASVGRLALTLYRLLRDSAIDLPDDPELIEELSRVRLIETAPGSYRIDHDRSEHDDRVISLALAALHLVERPAGTDWTTTYAKRCPSCDAVNPHGATMCQSCVAPFGALETVPLAENPWARIYGLDKPKPVQLAAKGGWLGGAPRGPWFGRRS